MKKLATILLAGLLLAAGLSLSAKEKLDADGFLRYLESQRSDIPYTKVEKGVLGDTLTLTVYCPKSSQEALQKAIEMSARKGYSFEGIDADSVACRIEFKAAAAAEPPREGCPGKVTVITRVLQPAVFKEYRDFSGTALPETIAVQSPTAGTVSVVNVLAGSRVDAGQELLALNAGLNEEVQALEQEAQRKKRILVARQNWKERSERAERAAEADYQKTLALLEQKKAQAAVVVAAPLAGTVGSLAAVAGAEVEAGAPLLEIVASRRLTVRIPIAAGDAGRFAVGEKVGGRAAGVEGELQAEIVAVDGEAAVLRLDDAEGRVAPGSVFTLRLWIADHADALAVPADALSQDSLGRFVYRVEKGRARKSYVTAGPSVDGMTLVAEGIAPQAQLVVSGSECLAEGKKVRVVSQEQLDKEQAAADAKRKLEQEKAAAREEARAKKEKEKADKLAAKQAKKAGTVPAAAEEKPTAARGEGKPECPKRVEVVAEPIQPQTFLEYRYFSATLQPEVIPVRGVVPGRISEVMVGEGARVEKGQELVRIDTSLEAELIKLQEEAARKLNVLESRRSAAKPSERAIQAAERDYQRTMEQLQAKSARFAHAVLAPAAGVVQGLVAVVGAEIAADAPLLEISSEDALVAALPLNMAESGDAQVVGLIAGLEGEVTARIAGLSDGRLLLRVDNAERRIQAGSVFTARRLKTRHNNAVVIPADALAKDSLGDFVYVVAKKRARKTYVGVGAREADRVLVLQGLAPEMALIVSGFACLEDGRKVSTVLPAAAYAAGAEIAGVEPAPGLQKEGRLKLGVHGSFALMFGENFKTIYQSANGFGGDLSYRFSDKLDVWLSGGLALKKAAVPWTGEELSFRMIPLAGAVRYYLMDDGTMSAYVGAGPNVFLVTDKNPVGDIQATLIGANAVAGGYYRFSSKFSLQLMAKFNLVKKDVVPDSTIDEPLDLTGLQFKLGVAFSF